MLETNSSSHTSSFLLWAQDIIEKEHQKNIKLADEIGYDNVFKEKISCAALTRSHLIDICKEIDQKRAQGLSLRKILADYPISTSTYYKYANCE